MAVTAKMSTISARLQNRAALLDEWQKACKQIVEFARALDVEAIQEGLAERNSLLEKIMSEHREYPWADSDRNRMRSLEDEVEQALLACHALLRDEVGAGRRRRTAMTRYAELARGG